MLKGKQDTKFNIIDWKTTFKTEHCREGYGILSIDFCPPFFFPPSFRRLFLKAARVQHDTDDRGTPTALAPRSHGL